MDKLTALKLFAENNGLAVVTYADLFEGETRTCAVYDPEDPEVFAYIANDSLYFVDDDFKLREVTPEWLAAMRYTE